jgi:hypothetical protein
LTREEGNERLNASPRLASCRDVDVGDAPVFSRPNRTAAACACAPLCATFLAVAFRRFVQKK